MTHFILEHRNWRFFNERFRILSGGNQVGKNGYFKASNTSTNYYNGTDPSSGTWHEVNSTVGNEQVFAITAHNTGTDNEGLVSSCI